MVRWQRPKTLASAGQSDEVFINGVNTASAERVVAKKNPVTGEIELKEEQVPLLPDDDDQVDEVDDSSDPAAAYTKTSIHSLHPKMKYANENWHWSGLKLIYCIAFKTASYF